MVSCMLLLAGPHHAATSFAWLNLSVSSMVYPMSPIPSTNHLSQPQLDGHYLYIVQYFTTRQLGLPQILLLLLTNQHATSSTSSQGVHAAWSIVDELGDGAGLLRTTSRRVFHNPEHHPQVRQQIVSHISWKCPTLSYAHRRRVR